MHTRKIIMTQFIILSLITSFLSGYNNIDKILIMEKCKNTEYTECMDATYDYRLNNNNEDIDWEYIETIYVNLCNLSHSEACQALGSLYAVDNNALLNHSWEESARYHIKGCQLNNMISCKALGGMHMLGIFYKKSYIKALPFLTKACNGKNISSCKYKEEVEELIENH
ncbi:MAG: hypothetical protein Q9M36_06715 [Sulfurovum sp.]|nr:hypothetical protein [Sulfurovum sp.]